MKNKLKIAILGTRGIPNNYGGFEQFAEYLSVGLVQNGHDVYVYNSHNHFYQQKTWRDVNIIHKYDPEHKVGTIGQFIYDLNCILDIRKRNFNVVLQLGYTSSSVWSFLFPKSSVIITNMDGLEWKRTKYGNLTRKFLKHAEKLAVEGSHYLLADSIGIKDYLQAVYSATSKYIPYGANLFTKPNDSILNKYGLSPNNYDLLIARLEPENSLDIILEGYISSSVDRKCVIIGNNKTKYGQYLLSKYGNDKRILFLGPLYDMEAVNNLRYFSNLYFHGHTVGGTNPSLLEAMASNALIIANDNEFNKAILGADAYYFSSPVQVKQLVETISKKQVGEENKLNANHLKITTLYTWPNIIHQYNSYIEECYFQKKGNN